MEAPLSMDVFNRHEITDAAVSAFADSSQIPEEYIRTEELHDGVVVGEDKSYQLPVIDMFKLLDPETSAQETRKLGDACRNWGFFQITNHGVEEVVMQQMKDNTEQFFRLPLESKKTVVVRPNSMEGFGHHFSRASSDKLDWAESLILTTKPVEARNLDMWPTNPSTFKHALDNYSMEMMELTLRLLSFMAVDLGIEEEELQAAFTGVVQSMAIHYYPPCQQPDKVLGIVPHTDGLGLTLLLHLDDTSGLQVSKDGKWFPVRPLPGAFVINIADILEVLSNGAYQSVKHRVVPDAERGRTTVVFFQAASVGGLVAPMLKGSDEEARYRSIQFAEYVKSNFRALAEGTRFIDSLKI